MKLSYFLAAMFYCILYLMDNSLAAMREHLDDSPKEAKMRVIILGGTNFIGPFVANALYDRGAEVYLFHRGTTSYNFSFPVKHIHGDRNKLLDYKSQFANLSPSVVIDMFPYSKNDAQTLVSVFKDLPSHLVIVSSGDVYKAYDRLWNNIVGKTEDVPLLEISKLRENYFPYRKQAKGCADLFYDYDKLLVEKVVLDEVAINCTILRLPFVMGPVIIHAYGDILND